jgi:GNAT superfamily N-acetyltransferase
MHVVTWAERPDLAERGVPSAGVWPEYNLHGDVFAEHWDAVLERFPQYQFALYDEQADAVLAEGHTGPLAWDGDDATLPAGIDDALRRVAAGGPADTLCALAAEVSPDARRQGLARALLEGMREIGVRAGLRRLIAPVRPSWKERYPLAPIERYVAWRREDGQLLDPWMRLHERLGARVGPPAPESMRITGSVSEWESWTGMVFPEPGAYVFPHGLAPLAVDTERGVYWEPNVWMIHPEL